MQSFFDMGKGEYQIMANLTKYEMETVVNYNAGEQTATVYTRDKSVMRRLDRLVADYPDMTAWSCHRKMVGLINMEGHTYISQLMR